MIGLGIAVSVNPSLSAPSLGFLGQASEIYATAANRYAWGLKSHEQQELLSMLAFVGHQPGSNFFLYWAAQPLTRHIYAVRCFLLEQAALVCKFTETQYAKICFFVSSA